MPKAIIDGQNEDRVWGHMVDDTGKDAGQFALPIAPLKEKQRKQRKSLEEIVAKQLGANAIEAERTLTEISVSVENGTPVTLRELFDLFEAKGHGHDMDGHVPAPHVHSDFEAVKARLTELGGDLAETVSRTSADHAKLARDLTHHDHDVPTHAHPGMQAQIDAIRAAVEAIPAPKTTEHDHSGYVAAETLTTAVAAIRSAISALEGQIVASEARVKAMIESIPAPVETVTESTIKRMVREAVANGLKDTQGRQVVLVQELGEVAGKPRWIAEAP